MISPQVVTVLRKRLVQRRSGGRLIVPADYAFEWRWVSRAEIAVFAIMALLVIWPLVDAAMAVHMLP
jgi:hypothetical protein